MARKVFPGSRLRQHSCPQRFLDLDCSHWKDLRGYFVQSPPFTDGENEAWRVICPRCTAGQRPGWDQTPVSTALATLAAPLSDPSNPGTEGIMEKGNDVIGGSIRGTRAAGCPEERAQVGSSSVYK